MGWTGRYPVGRASAGMGLDGQAPGLQGSAGMAWRDRHPACKASAVRASAGRERRNGLRPAVMVMDQIQQPAEAFVKRFRIQGVHAEFIELRHKRLDIFQLIQRVSVFPGRLPVQGAVALIDLLHRGLLQGTVGEGLLAVGYGVMDEHRAASDGIFPLFIAKLLKGGEEGVPHFPVRKADAHVHGKGIRGGKFPQPEAGQPPVEALLFIRTRPFFRRTKLMGSRSESRAQE